MRNTVIHSGLYVRAPNIFPRDFRADPIQAVTLVVFRLTLMAQYCSVWHYYRGRKDSKKAFGAAAMTHFAAAMIYLGIAFRFDHYHNSKAHIVWYVVSAVEGLIQLGLAWKFEVLKLNGRKLPERLATLTIMIIGEGVAKISKNIFLLAENNQRWSA